MDINHITLQNVNTWPQFGKDAHRLLTLGQELKLLLVQFNINWKHKIEPGEKWVLDLENDLEPYLEVVD